MQSIEMKGLLLNYHSFFSCSLPAGKAKVCHNRGKCLEENLFNEHYNDSNKLCFY